VGALAEDAPVAIGKAAKRANSHVMHRNLARTCLYWLNFSLESAFVLIEIVSVTKFKSDPSSTSSLYVTSMALRLEELMPRFYFDLKSKESRIPDDGGRDFDTLNEAYEHGRKLIDKILLHTGYDGANEWKVIVSNDEDDGELIIPFTVSYLFGSRQTPQNVRNASHPLATI
jgi:hypothetical protein